MYEEIHTAINEAVEPSDAEVMLARRSILARLADGDVVGTYVLASEVVQPADHRLLDQKAALPSLRPVVHEIRDEPRIAWTRNAIAAVWATAELAVRGSIVACETPRQAPGQTLSAKLETVPWQAPGYGSGTTITVPLPKLAATHYQIARHLRGEAWYADPDVLRADLTNLGLDPRTHRCITEATDCWRRGLYLAAANMLGAAFEGAWMTAAQQLRHVNPSIEKAVGGESPKVATVQTQVTQFFRARGLGLQADALLSHAVLLRELRNYGVHPKPATDDRLERHFDEATAGLLILTTHHHLASLAQSVEAIRSKESR